MRKLFLKLLQFGKCEFTIVNNHFENERNKKDGVFLSTRSNTFLNR